MRCCCNDGDPAAPGIPAPPNPSVSSSTSKADAQAGRAVPFKAWPRRIATFIQWALPITTLALIPKCPACVAAYVLLFTGLGISLPAATATRWTLISLCIAVLAYLVFRVARRALTTCA